MPALPPPPAHRLTAAEAVSVAKRGRKLLRAGRLTHRQFAVLDCLLWSCRNPITGAIVVSYTALQRLAHTSRETIAGALAALERLRVLTKIKRRIRLAWHQGGQQTRQATSAYLLHPSVHSEFGGATVNPEAREILYVQQQATSRETSAAQAALAARRAAIEARLLNRWSGGVGLAL